jgi:hypothetical protein
MAVNTQESIFSEVTEFIVSQPSLETIAAYQASPGAQGRMEHLLEKNREEGLLPEEREEADKYLALSYLMSLVKVKARLKLRGKIMLGR